MNTRIITLSVVLGSMALTSVAQAQPQNMVNGILNLGGAIILNEALKRQQSQPVPQRQAQPGPTRNNSALYSGTAGKSRAQVHAETIILRQEIQRRLNALGLDAGDPDGVFGPRSRRAISAFQRQIGERATGNITEGQINRLYRMTGGHPAASGAPAPVVAAAFPPLAGTAPAPEGAGFPVLAGTPAPGAAPAFPALGGSPASAAPAPAFPALAGSPAAQPTQPAFPPVSPEQQSVTAAPAFPALVAAGPTPSAPSFPALAPGATAPDTPFPQLAGAAPPPASAPIAVPLGPTVAPTLDEVFSNVDPARLESAALYGATPFATEQEQPRIFGAVLGSQHDDAMVLLAEAGFDQCDTSQGIAVSCTRATETANESVAIKSLPDGQVWQLRRTVQFEQPIENTLLLEQIRVPYPYLVQTGIVATPSCTPESLATASEGFDALAMPAAPADLTVAPQVVQAILQCPLTYELNLSGDDRSDSFELIFTHAAALVQAVLGEQAKMIAEEQRQMTEVTKALTF